MSESIDPANSSGCSGHDHEEEESDGCSCGGICGRRNLLENLKGVISEKREFEPATEPAS